MEYFQSCCKPAPNTPEPPQIDQFSIAALDAEMMEVLQCTSLTSNEKWIHYYKTLERHLYKKDPNFKPIQFKFEVQEESSGAWSYKLRSDQKESFVSKYLPTFIGPLIGAAFSAIVRWW